MVGTSKAESAVDAVGAKEWSGSQSKHNTAGLVSTARRRGGPT